MARTEFLAMWCPVQRRREFHAGSCMELENVADDAKAIGTSGNPTRLKAPMRRRGADCFVVAMKWGDACRRKRNWFCSSAIRFDLALFD
jgi:hypothetical protein